MKTLLLAAPLLAVVGLAKADLPPNIIFIFTDDQGWGDLGTPMDPAVPEATCSSFHTPNLDRLASEGMRFSSGYASAPLCTPTQRSIQFGMTPARQRGTEFFSEFRPGHAGRVRHWEALLVQLLAGREEGLSDGTRLVPGRFGAFTEAFKKLVNF